MINESLCSNLDLKWPAMVMVVVYCLLQYVPQNDVPPFLGTHEELLLLRLINLKDCF